MRTIEDVFARLRAEFLEMPGLRLTPDQVQRLCGIDHRICHMVLKSLVAEGLLCVKADGRYARLTDGEYCPSMCRDEKSKDFVQDWPILGTTRSNVHLTGPAGAVEQSLAALLPDCDLPVRYWTLDALLPSPQGVKTLVIRNVDALSAEQQRALLSWLEHAVPPTRVVSTTTVPLFQHVTAGLFLDVLYYRLNTVMFDGANAAVAPDYPRPQPAKADFRTDPRARKAS